ncbi:hypothetical protein SLEP1_g42217 [Rubroshorea leprosula]|uniref:Uncharacterized protein n=1 Tax=Rubroshorea leprosula TaxID=152421 RepID=A0AAV5L935_9ROSI|nr:hypothetical protein SLEP1_g42217 [Rubroshorea leprosula]
MQSSIHSFNTPAFTKFLKQFPVSSLDSFVLSLCFHPEVRVLKV